MCRVARIAASWHPRCAALRLLCVWGNMETRLFSTGEQILTSGIYRVIHAAHRLPHECTLIQGQVFPRCAKCGDLVEFECVATAPHWKSGPTRTINLHELPELPQDSEQVA